MIAVIFEVWPADGRKQSYLDIAAQLKPELEKIDGFLSIERFQSLTDDKKLLSLSFWRDETAVKAWRNMEHHRQAQHDGRSGVLRDYRLRVASVLRDYGMNQRAEAPADSRTVNG
jgi:heme-degrading monooxygenase HmoA